MRPMHTRRARTTLARLVVLAAALAIPGACATPRIADGHLPPPIVLDVQNHGYFDVAVYAVQADAGVGARLGLVPGASRARLAVRRSDLQPGGQLVLRLHAIGTHRQWVSPAVTVGDGIEAQLEVYMDADGRMGRTTIQTGPAVTAARWLVATRAP